MIECGKIKRTFCLILLLVLAKDLLSAPIAEEMKEARFVGSEQIKKNLSDEVPSSSNDKLQLDLAPEQASDKANKELTDFAAEENNENTTEFENFTDHTSTVNFPYTTAYSSNGNTSTDKNEVKKNITKDISAGETQSNVSLNITVTEVPVDKDDEVASDQTRSETVVNNVGDEANETLSTDDEDKKVLNATSDHDFFVGKDDENVSIKEKGKEFYNDADNDKDSLINNGDDKFVSIDKHDDEDASLDKDEDKDNGINNDDDDVSIDKDDHDASIDKDENEDNGIDQDDNDKDDDDGDKDDDHDDDASIDKDDGEDNGIDKDDDPDYDDDVSIDKDDDHDHDDDDASIDKDDDHDHDDDASIDKDDNEDNGIDQDDNDKDDDHDEDASTDKDEDKDNGINNDDVDEDNRIDRDDDDDDEDNSLDQDDDDPDDDDKVDNDDVSIDKDEDKDNGINNDDDDVSIDKDDDHDHDDDASIDQDDDDDDEDNRIDQDNDDKDDDDDDDHASIDKDDDDDDDDHASIDKDDDEGNGIDQDDDDDDDHASIDKDDDEDNKIDQDDDDADTSTNKDDDEDNGIDQDDDDDDVSFNKEDDPDDDASIDKDDGEDNGIDNDDDAIIDKDDDDDDEGVSIDNAKEVVTLKGDDEVIQDKGNQDDVSTNKENKDFLKNKTSINSSTDISVPVDENDNFLLPTKDTFLDEESGSSDGSTVGLIGRNCEGVGEVKDKYKNTSVDSYQIISDELDCDLNITSSQVTKPNKVTTFAERKEEASTYESSSANDNDGDSDQLSILSADDGSSLNANNQDTTVNDGIYVSGSSSGGYIFTNQNEAFKRTGSIVDKEMIHSASSDVDTDKNPLSNSGAEFVADYVFPSSKKKGPFIDEESSLPAKIYSGNDSEIEKVNSADGEVEKRKPFNESSLEKVENFGEDGKLYNKSHSSEDLGFEEYPKEKIKRDGRSLEDIVNDGLSNRNNETDRPKKANNGDDILPREELTDEEFVQKDEKFQELGNNEKMENSEEGSGIHPKLIRMPRSLRKLQRRLCKGEVCDPNPIIQISPQIPPFLLEDEPPYHGMKEPMGLSP